MLRMKVLVMIFCYVSQLCYIYALLKVEQRQLEFTEQELIFGHESFKDGKLTYAVCTNNHKSNEKICQVIREKTPLSNDTMSCNVTLKINAKKNKKRSEIINQFGIVPFGKDKAILYIVRKISRRLKCRFNTIQFDGCKVAETDITVARVVTSKYQIIVIPYNNSYDVIYPCTLKGFVKTTIDSDGERINGPIELGYFLWLAHFPYILPISRKSRKKGLVYLSFAEDSPGVYDLMILRSDGSEDLLGSHEIALRSIKSVDNDFIGLCHDFNNSYNLARCTQYGVDGKAKFGTDIVSHDNQTIAFIYNLPGGGLFLLGGQPSNETENIDFFVLKLDADGYGVGSISLGEMKLKARALTATFYKTGDDEYCISVADYNAIDMEINNQSNFYYIHQIVNCFSDFDFSVRKET